MPPETRTPRWCAMQASVPAIGLTDSDHRQPGSRLKRATFTPLRSTTAMLALDGVRSSSGVSKLLLVAAAMALSSFVVAGSGDRLDKDTVDRPGGTTNA